VIHKTQLHQVLDCLQEGFYLVDSSGRINHWNKAAERLTGHTADEVLGSRCSENILVHVDSNGDPLCTGNCPLMAALRDGGQKKSEAYLQHRNGHRIPVSVSVVPTRDRNGEIDGAVQIFEDRSPQVIASEHIEELRALALLDHLTGLANRRFTESALHARAEEHRRYGWPFAVLLMDLDRFKEINDEYGHVVGDQVLCVAGKSLAHGVRKTDLLGRWGGDEFIAIIANASEEPLQATGNRLRALVERSTVNTDEETIGVSISVGGVMCRPGEDVDSLIYRADHLLYEAKASGRNCVKVEADHAGPTYRRAAA
jgi:diguanylate cyclase (GGDEF)-like protein/PAS domain S-box-containing protein